MHGVCSSPAAALAGDSLPEYVVLLHAMDSNTHPLASARDCSPPGQCVVTCKPSLCHRTGAWLISRTRMSLQTRIGSACTFQAKITNSSAHDSRALTARHASLWKSLFRECSNITYKAHDHLPVGGLCFQLTTAAPHLFHQSRCYSSVLSALV